MKLPLSVIWMQDKSISDTMDKEKDVLIAKTGGTVVTKDKDTDWKSLKADQKKKLMEAYYTKEELNQVTEKELDAIAPDKFVKPVAEVEAAPEIIIP